MSIVKFTNGKFPALNINGTKVYLKKVSPSVTIGGHKYPVVKIGSLLWISEDLLLTSNSSQVEFYDYDSINYFNNNAATLFPDGWRVPTRTDINNLSNFIISEGNSVSDSLRSTEGWTSSNGLDLYGFNAQPKGYIDKYGRYSDVGTAFFLRPTDGHYWLNATSSGFNWWNNDPNTTVYRFPVRLVKDT